MRTAHTVGWWLALVGALNWGLVGLGMLLGSANLNVVHMLLGTMPALENLVYVFVGLGGVLMLLGRAK